MRCEDPASQERAPTPTWRGRRDVVTGGGRKRTLSTRTLMKITLSLANLHQLDWLRDALVSQNESCLLFFVPLCTY